jgi:RNA polymerase sigma-70 factor (ECF subfamily)
VSEPSRVASATTASGTAEAAARADEDVADRALVDAWLGGDERAATTLVERHGDALSRFAISVGVRDRSEVEEVVQDTFVRAFQSLASFRGESSLRTWLFTIERRLVLDRRRAERRRRDRDEVKDSDAATEVTPLDGMVADETERRVGAAVERLSAMQRQVFTLRVTEGLSYKEIAAVVGTTEGAARVHYHNAVRAIKECLDG